MRHIAESGLIDDTDLDMLARAFIAADNDVYWRVPESWFGDESVEIHMGDGTESDTDEVPDEEEAVAARRVAPPLRRWAAARLIACDPSEWAPLFVEARDRQGAEGAAIMRGLLDELHSLEDAVQGVVIEVGVGWSQAGVRRHALERLADRGERQIAYDRALRDPSAGIRRWAPALLETDPDQDEPTDPDTGTATRRPPDTLF